MKALKISIPVLFFLLISPACFAKGIVSISLGMEMEAKFVYLQTVHMLNGHATVRRDITNEIPHEIKKSGRIETLVVL